MPSGGLDILLRPSPIWFHSGETLHGDHDHRHFDRVAAASSARGPCGGATNAMRQTTASRWARQCISTMRLIGGSRPPTAIAQTARLAPARCKNEWLLCVRLFAYIEQPALAGAMALHRGCFSGVGHLPPSKLLTGLQPTEWVRGVFGFNRGASISQISDGTSNTFMLSELMGDDRGRLLPGACPGRCQVGNVG